MTVLEIDDVHLAYRRGGVTTHAIKGVTIDVDRAEVVGVVGESGCGKSSLARCVVGLAVPDRGEIRLDGVRLGGRRSKEERRRVQMIFQDPRSALDPRMTVFQLLDEAWRTHPSVAPQGARRDAAVALLEQVGLRGDILERRPAQVSGGQAQRVAIARALSVDPDVLVCDEAVSALDVSVQSQILELLLRLRRERALSMLFISHDLGVIRLIADRVAVMYFGEIVESGPVEEVFDRPQHEYTKTLLDAALDVVM